MHLQSQAPAPRAVPGPGATQVASARTARRAVVAAAALTFLYLGAGGVQGAALAESASTTPVPTAVEAPEQAAPPESKTTKAPEAKAPGAKATEGRTTDGKTTGKVAARRGVAGRVARQRPVRRTDGSATAARGAARATSGGTRQAPTTAARVARSQRLVTRKPAAVTPTAPTAGQTGRSRPSAAVRHAPARGPESSSTATTTSSPPTTAAPVAEPSSTIEVGPETAPTAEEQRPVDILLTAVAAAKAEGPPIEADASAASPALLGTAGEFSILAASTITNTGASTLVGDVGLSPGSAVTGFAPCTAPAPADCVTLAGDLHVADGVALQAQLDQSTAYDALVSQESSCTNVDVELGGRTFLPGVYCSPGTFNLAAGGIVTLNAQGDPDAQFVFLTGSDGSTLITGARSQVLVIGGAQACNVYWQVASSATIGVGTAFVGHVLAKQSIQLQTGATLHGSAFAQNGAVTLDTNTITRATCGTTPVVTPPGGGTPGGGTPGDGTPGGTPGGGTPGGGTPGGGTPVDGGTTDGGTTGAGRPARSTIGSGTGASGAGGGLAIALRTTSLTGAGPSGAVAIGQITPGGLRDRGELARTGTAARLELHLAGTAIGLGALLCLSGARQNRRGRTGAGSASRRGAAG